MATAAGDGATERVLEWPVEGDPGRVLTGLRADLRRPGVVVVRFAASRPGAALPWPLVERWTSSRALTVADVTADLAVPAAEIALCADLVYLRSGVSLHLPEPSAPPTAALTWAFARAGRAALRHGLLGGGVMTAAEAVALGLAQAVLPAGAPLPLPDPRSLAAATAARDLLRSRDLGSRPTLELATFRYLFATGDPEEGATAFLQRRPPRFSDPDDHHR